MTLVGVYLTGERRWYGQFVQFLSQGLWWVLIFQREMWGLIPLEIGLTFLYARNSFSWYRYEQYQRLLRRGS